MKIKITAGIPALTIVAIIYFVSMGIAPLVNYLSGAPVYMEKLYLVPSLQFVVLFIAWMIEKCDDSIGPKYTIATIDVGMKYE